MNEIEYGMVRWLVATTRHLTGGELYRLLHRYDLDEAVREALWREEDEAANCCDEAASEQFAETGRYTRWYTRLERYIDRHPLYGCEPKPWNWGLNEDDIPF